MRLGWSAVALAALTVLVSGCGPRMPERVPLDSSDGVLDLRSWDFARQGPVLPLGWLWDADLLWTPDSGRPHTLVPAAPLGPPSLGGSLRTSLKNRARTSVPVVATAQITLLVADRQNYALQMGALPGAYRVWVNGVVVADSGVPSSDPQRFRSDGQGAVLSVQPQAGKLDIVVNFATTDPLVGHVEWNRQWIIGPSSILLRSQEGERGSRIFQVTFLLLGAALFIAMSLLRRDRKTLLLFVAFLFVCLLKTLMNVEEVHPLLSLLFPGVSPSVYLIFNHGLNLLPFPFFVLFLVRQFPQDVSYRSFLMTSAATVLVTVWELFPLVALAWGQEDLYAFFLRIHWTTGIDLYVVVMVLLIFERLYLAWSKKRPLSGALFFGGVGIGLILLLPIPLSYFLPVQYTLFFGWGLFFFLVLLGFDLFRLQVATIRSDVGQLATQLERSRTLGRFIGAPWSSKVGRDSPESLIPGDRRRLETTFVQVLSSDPAELWLRGVGELADSRQALLVHWREGVGVWALDSWAESALSFALDVQKKLLTLPGLRYRIVAARASVEFRILNAGACWVPTVDGVPWTRLEQLSATASRYGATVVLDANLQDGLVIGGWRHHRHLTPASTEIELYELEPKALVEGKDGTQDAFETALGHAREGQWAQALESLVIVLQQNPLDPAARALLLEWGETSH